MVARRPAQDTAWISSTITTMTATAATNQIRQPNASASERNGFGGCLTGAVRRPNSDHVDGRVDDHPHDVDEVPVDPRHLHALVVLGRVVAAESTNSDHQQREQ